MKRSGPLKRRTPLKAKTPLKRTPINRGKHLPRTKPAKRQKAKVPLWWDTWKDMVIARDGHVCRVCRQRRPTTAHHLIPQGHIRNKHPLWWLWHPDNGIGICHYCHAIVHADHESKGSLWIVTGRIRATEFMATCGQLQLPGGTAGLTIEQVDEQVNVTTSGEWLRSPDRKDFDYN